MFKCGRVSSHMYFVVRGLVRYRLPKKRILEKSTFVPLQHGAWLSEAVLWVQWVHQGTAMAFMDSEVAMLDARQFFQVVERFADAYALARERARELFAIMEVGASG